MTDLISVSEAQSLLGLVVRVEPQDVHLIYPPIDNNICCILTLFCIARLRRTAGCRQYQPVHDHSPLSAPTQPLHTASRHVDLLFSRVNALSKSRRLISKVNAAPTDPGTAKAHAEPRPPLAGPLARSRGPPHCKLNAGLIIPSPLRSTYEHMLRLSVV